MKRVAVALAVTLLLTATAHAKPPPSHPPSHGPPPAPHVWVRPAPPLPMLPSIARVRVEAARDRVVLLEEVNLPRGDWQSGGLDLFVAGAAAELVAHLRLQRLEEAVGRLERVDAGGVVADQPFLGA